MKIDLNLGVHPKATAILLLVAHQLEDQDPNVMIKTSAWYNGRENGICIMKWGLSVTKPARFITFGECRNSDSIFLDTWLEVPDINPPTSFPDSAYRARKFYSYDAICKVADEIVNLLNSD